jgi:TrmH family RNA methyltransferase
VRDPGNVGTLLRTADAFDASVALSSGCGDTTGPKAVRASMGALFRVPTGGVRGGRSSARRTRLARRTPLAELDLGPQVTFVLGAEREGPSGRAAARRPTRSRRSRSPSTRTR